jgi:hypothetical protein
MKLHAALIALLTIPMIATAQTNTNYRCTMGELIRRVVVDRDTAAPVPCQVAYYKDSEAPGERQVLWSAENDASYCEARATEFVAQLENWGWQCGAPESSAGVDIREDDDI